jgi:flavodoxin/NAD-dependent dihydropyrimidine dehydrogenase PreA subunit
MKSVGIFFFSGTGNTELVAEMVSEKFSEFKYQVDLMRIEDILKGSLKIDLIKYDLVGIGCQVIGYGVPNLMHIFMSKLPEVKGVKVFIFRTAGGVGPINYNASNSIIKKLSRKGYVVFHERIFSIGSNWVVKFDNSIMKQLYKATEKKVSIMCEEVIAGKTRLLRTGLKLRLGMGMAAPVFSILLRLSGKDLKVSKACSHCGLCIKNCPAGNIYEKNSRVKFRLYCNCCLRCVYSCPQNAINFKILSFFSGAGRI